MLPNAVSGVVRQGRMGEEISMGIDPAALAHIMNVLTDLYSDPELAIIREYSTNARDAHVEAGVTLPIEVTTPSLLNSNLVIRDHGIGLNPDSIRRIYSQYGASTKRGTNAQSGMLGLGCKSALTYTNQFSVESVKDGVKSFLTVSRSEDGSGVMEIIETPTTESNGTTVTIPAKSGNSIKAKAEKFFSFWEPGSVLLNEKEPVALNVDELDNDIYVYDNLGMDYIVMGGVPYPIKNLSLKTRAPYRSDFNIIRYVPIGTVDFTPNREELMLTARTKDVIAKTATLTDSAIVKRAQEDIDAAPTFPEAARRFNKWAKRIYIQKKDVKYKGQRIEETWFSDGDYFVVTPNRTRNQVSRYNGSTVGGQYNTSSISRAALEKAVLVLNGPVTDITASQRAKMRYLLTTNVDGAQFGQFIVFPDNVLPGGVWTADLRTMQWKDILKIKVPKAPATTTSVGDGGLYDVLDPKTRVWSQVKDLDPSKTYAYFSHAERISITKGLTDLMADATIIRLNKNRWGKLTRICPKAIHISEVVKEYVQTAFNNLTYADRISWDAKVRYENTGGFRLLDPSTVDDPELKVFIQGVHNSLKGSPTYDAYLSIFRISKEISGIPCPQPERVENLIAKNYPLALNISNDPRVIDHVIKYVNTIYKENNK